MAKNAKIEIAAVEVAAVEVAAVEVAAVETPKVKKTFRFYKAGPNVDLAAKVPPQAKAILKFMAETNFRGTGPAIISAMIAANLITTRQDPAVLFAFYARKLESLGLIRE